MYVCVWQSHLCRCACPRSTCRCTRGRWATAARRGPSGRPTCGHARHGEVRGGVTRVSNSRALSTRKGRGSTRARPGRQPEAHTGAWRAREREKASIRHTAHAPSAVVDASVGVHLFALAVAPAFRELPCASSSSSSQSKAARDEAVVERKVIRKHGHGVWESE